MNDINYRAKIKAFALNMLMTVFGIKPKKHFLFIFTFKKEYNSNQRIACDQTYEW